MSDIEKEIEEWDITDWQKRFEQYVMSGHLSPYDMETLEQAAEIIKAQQAELASIKQQVVFVDENSDPEVGDLVSGMRSSESEEFIAEIGFVDSANNPIMGEWRCLNGRYFTAYRDIKIILRNNQPVLVRK